MPDALPSGTVRRVREWRIGVNNAELWVAEQGLGPPFVLCPGGAGLCDYLGPVAAMVDDLVRVYRFDPRGCGRSSVSPPYDLPTLLADLDGLRAALGLERWLVGGHSFGADLALAYALEHSERVVALVYVSGTGIQDDRQWHAAYEAGKAAGRDPTPAFDYPFNPQVNREANTSWRTYIKEPMLLRRIAELHVPLFAVGGSEDVRPHWPVEQLVELMPNARLEMIVGAGHCPWLTHDSELRSRVRHFLRELAAQTGAGAGAPVLSDETVVLDSFQLDDAEGHLAGEDEEFARRFGWFPRRSTLAGVRESIARWREQWATAGPTRAFSLRLAPAGELIGGCELRIRDDGAAHMSYWTFATYRRRGFATRAVRLAAGYGFDTLHVTQIELQIKPDNVASRGVARCAGFTEAGTIQMSPGSGAEPRTMLRYVLTARLP